MAINWTQVNVPTIVTVLGVAYGIVTYFNDLDGRLKNTDDNVVGMKSDIATTKQTMQDIPYRVGNLEKGLDEAGKRTDRLTDVVLSGMDNVRKDINTLGTKIEVLSSKMEDAFPKRRTDLGPLYSVPQRN